jgi:hypothetical protein
MLSEDRSLSGTGVESWDEVSLIRSKRSRHEAFAPMPKESRHLPNGYEIVGERASRVRLSSKIVRAATSHFAAARFRIVARSMACVPAVRRPGTPVCNREVRLGLVSRIDAVRRLSDLCTRAFAACIYPDTPSHISYARAYLVAPLGVNSQ